MSAGFNSAPPSYNAPSTAGHIIELSDSALAIQKAFADARYIVDRMGKTLGTDYSKKLLELDTKYNALFSDCRCSATTLQGHMKRFAGDVVPIAQDTSETLEDRIELVKDVADDLANAAKRHDGVFQKGLLEILAELDTILQAIKAEEVRVRDENKAVLEQAETKINEVATKVEKNTTAFGVFNLVFKGKSDASKQPASQVHGASAKSGSGKGSNAPATPRSNPPPITGVEARYKDVFEGVHLVTDFFQRIAVTRLANLRKEADKQLEQLSKAGEQIDAMSKDLKALGENVSAFNTAWQKLVTDACNLSQYLAAGNIDEKAFLTVLISETEVYKSIRAALDEFALRV
ncbi:hypothetical protein CVT24_010383 [Panaeolus cyanescens]|uniref:Uncharacterized protein n=1 Tax=Panaeolus cyanescens TaxID=181874 RepID=A0A409YQ44_9AGAR|nr:hypothetical protein CVT24_010383 [Panaeolus cyanescens]